MAKNLVLVESPSKAKTINKYLGRNYIVAATVGHIRNLPKTKLGVDIENDFEPQLLNIRGKGDLIKKIRSLSAKAEKIYIATDPDREGEAIAQDIVDTIDGKTSAEIFRVLFNEITKKSVKKAMDSPLPVNQFLVSSQRARRVMDRIIGYKVSPFLWNAIVEAAGNSLSAGRVQSVALRLICEREEEIDKFIKTEYWSIIADFTTEKGDILSTKLASFDGKLLRIQPNPVMTSDDWEEFNKKYFAINSEEQAENLLKAIRAEKSFVINEITKKEQKRNPYPPFITSTLQAEASKKLRMRPSQTMKIAQQLYEGIELGKDDGTVGLITYMRTDSTRLGEEILSDVQKFINDKYGKNYTPKSPRNFSKKDKKVQDAHEAIRPTDVKYSPEYVKQYLNQNQFALYELVWKRFVASQMEAALLETTTISIEAGKYIFKTSGTAIKFDGFLALYDEGKEESNDQEDSPALIPVGLEQNDKLNLNSLNKNQHFTKPSPRFTESSLIKELESNGIGRPSTYASILGTIMDREYVEQMERKLSPTGLGKKVNKVLVDYFPKLFNVNFTASMEDELDSIATGELEYKKAMEDFYIPFDKYLKEVDDKIEKVKCEKCGSDMEIKIGRFGKFLACSNYPNCKNIKSLKEVKQENVEPEFTGETCPKCGSKTVYRSGKFGRFIGCENYPDCDYTEQITLGIKCPKCKEGEVVARRSKKGRYFYGCSRYPDCDYVSWKKPTENESV